MRIKAVKRHPLLLKEKAAKKKNQRLKNLKLLKKPSKKERSRMRN